MTKPSSDCCCRKEICDYEHEPGCPQREVDQRFRAPRLGDRITTVDPFRNDSPMCAAGSRPVVVLSTEASVEYARYLIASGRWMICGDDETER